MKYFELFLALALSVSLKTYAIDSEVAPRDVLSGECESGVCPSFDTSPDLGSIALDKTSAEDASAAAAEPTSSTDDGINLLDVPLPTIDLSHTQNSAEAQTFLSESPYAEFIKDQAMLDPTNSYLMKAQPAEGGMPTPAEVQELKGENMFLGEQNVEANASLYSAYTELSDAFWSGRQRSSGLEENAANAAKANLIQQQSQLNRMVTEQ